MIGTWVKEKNHIAIKCNNEILHPSAAEMFEIVAGNKENIIPEIECKDIRECFPKLRLSQIGSDIVCELTNHSDDIWLSLYCIRKGKKIEVDVIDGHIVDQCITDDEWFYVTGCTLFLIELFEKLNIKSTGKITISQYIEIIRNRQDLGDNCLLNSVETSLLDKPVDSNGEIPHTLKAKLYNYQKTGYFWMKYMLEENSGCILGDEMGLGKTMQIITLMLAHKECGRLPILVIAPVSLLQNWKSECARFAPSLKTLIHHGPKRTGRYKTLIDYDVVIISYNTAVSDSSVLKMVDWELVVLDEAQNIKNPSSDRTRFVKMIPRRESIAVTGTPFENHVTDIWSLVDFTMPGLFGTQSEYARYITDDIEGADKIEPLLSPIMIRRMVADVASDLPEKIVIPQPIEMSESEAISYEDMRNKAVAESKNGNVGIGTLQKLRMFCTHPYLCNDENGHEPYKESVKYQRMCEILEEIISSNEKVILFTSYQKMFEIIENDIGNRYGIPILKINGTTDAELRQPIVDQFNKYDGSALLVLNPRAAGVGLNITSANHVIHYNLEWNPALEDQASARAFRRGQTKTVFVYRLFYIDTVEQVVNERIERKREIAKTAVIGTDGTNKNREDIIEALRLSPMREV